HLKREITLFRLLEKTLGERRDITRILDWDFDRPPYFIESQYTAGGSLREWADAQGGLALVPLGIRLEIVAQVAVALAAAHSVGVLHKDVKPGNVLICGGGGQAQAQLSDFGIGSITDRERLAQADITVLGWTEDSSDPRSSAGTPLYRAPELLEGKPSTLQADIYALGVLLYQIVLGDFSRALAPGWRGEIREAVAEAEDPALRGEDVGELLAEDIAAAVQGAPERRLRDAEELARRLRCLGERGRKRAIDRWTAGRAARWQRRRQGMAWAVAALGLLCVASIVMSWRVNQEAAKARAISDLLVDMIERGDPFSPWLTDESQAEASAATSVVHRILSNGVGRLPELADQPEVRARLTHTFGRAFLHLGHYGQAASLLEEALGLQGRPGGQPEARREITLDLADVLRAQGRYASAESLYRQVRETLRGQALGGEPKEKAMVLSGLAWTLQAQGDLEAAEALFRRALETRRQVFGPGHHTVGSSLNNIAGVLQARGDLAAAEPFYRQALEILRSTLGDEHPLVADIFNNLAGVLQAQGRLAAAEPLYRRALEVRSNTLGPSHSLVATSLNNLAWLRVASGEPQAAEQLILDALAIYRRALPADHWRIPNAESILAATFSERGRFDEAEDLLLASYPRILEGTGERSQYTRDLLSRLIRLYELWGKPAEAAIYREQRRASGALEPLEPSDAGAGLAAL
ncbi:MAG: tetratricopeptide repeat-containing serine/threonine-protein kinase, partial [Holophagales bacterium]|nr:tetratricopeptide repeat-containing serine/threonine-protein kinase [Holophagales bacterium]